MRQIGIWSYSLYLWQQPFYQLINKGYGPTYGLFIAAIFAGLVSFYFIEMPLRTFLNARKFSGLRTHDEPEIFEIDNAEAVSE